MEVEGMEVEGVAAAPYVPDFSTLLSKDGFHRALYTCAAEVVMKINNHTALSFPRSLQVFEVRAPLIYTRVPNPNPYIFSVLREIFTLRYEKFHLPEI